MVRIRGVAGEAQGRVLSRGRGGFGLGGLEKWQHGARRGARRAGGEEVMVRIRGVAGEAQECVLGRGKGGFGLGELWRSGSTARAGERAEREVRKLWLGSVE